MSENKELIAKVTEVMREADLEFEKTGGGTRHYVRELLLPMLEEKGLIITDTSSPNPLPEEREPVYREVRSSDRLPGMGIQVFAYEQEAPIYRGTLEINREEPDTVIFKYWGSRYVLSNKAERLKDIFWLEPIPTPIPQPAIDVPIAFNGWAPGNYSCKCGICKSEFMGDKRAVTCKPCADKMAGIPQPVSKETDETLYQEWLNQPGIEKGPSIPESLPTEEIPEELSKWIKERAYLHAKDKWGEHVGYMEFENSRSDFEAALIFYFGKLRHGRYYHDIHCNTRGDEPMGCPGCSCLMTQRVRKAEVSLSSMKDEIEVWQDAFNKMRYEKNDYLSKMESEQMKVASMTADRNEALELAADRLAQVNQQAHALAMAQSDAKMWKEQLDNFTKPFHQEGTF